MSMIAVNSGRKEIPREADENLRNSRRVLQVVRARVDDMNDEDRENALGLNVAPWVGRSRFLPQAGIAVINELSFGIVFIMAFWSGPSRQAFVALKNVAARLDPNGLLELVVVDTDGCPSLNDHPQITGTLHGWGEALWIRKGVIVSAYIIGRNADCLEPMTTALLGLGNDVVNTA